MTTFPRASHRSALVFALAVTQLPLPGCALFSRGETLHVRYFTLEPPGGTEAPAPPPGGAEAPAPVPAAAAEPSSAPALRLGRIDASDGLTQDLIVRTGANELSYREDQRWTERPTAYVRRGLERELFQKRDLTRVYSGAAPTLDVELVELEIALSPAPRARVRLLSHLRDHRRGLCDDSSVFEQAVPPLQGDAGQVTPEAVAALSQVMQRALEHLAARTLQCLAANTQPHPSQPQ